jgi:hypothetical protein
MSQAKGVHLAAFKGSGNLVFSKYPDRDQENFLSSPVTREAFVEKNLKLSNLISAVGKFIPAFPALLEGVANGITNQVILYIETIS